MGVLIPAALLDIVVARDAREATRRSPHGSATTWDTRLVTLRVSP
jgi:hypothetical protein